MMRVALTGGFATGKTAVLKMFKRLGASIISADDIVHEEFRRNARLRGTLTRYFGPEILAVRGVRRDALAEKVFKSPRQLRRLNAIVHPVVKRRMLSFLKQKKPRGAPKGGASGAVAVVEVPLLFEASLEKFFDVVVVVTARVPVRRERLRRARRFAARDLRSRARHQMPLAKKIAAADFIVDNNGARSATFKQVKALMKIFRRY